MGPPVPTTSQTSRGHPGAHPSGEGTGGELQALLGCRGGFPTPGALPFRANYSQGEQPLSLFAGEARHRSGRTRTGQVWGALSHPKPHTELPPQTGAASPLRLGCSLPGYKGAANAVQSSPRYKNRSLSMICFSSKAAEANYTATNYHALILLSSPRPGCCETWRCLPIPLPPLHGHFQRWHCSD